MGKGDQKMALENDGNGEAEGLNSAVKKGGKSKKKSNNK